MPNGELYDVYKDNIIQAGKTKTSIRYAFKNEPRFLVLSQKRKLNIYRIEFLLKSNYFSQEDLIGISNKKFKIPVWIEV